MPIPSPDERYIKLEIKTLDSGQQVYMPAIPIDVPVDPVTDITLVANDQDRMDIIGNNQFGSAMSWWRIAQGNSLVNGRIHIKAGTPIIVPSPNT